MCLKRYQSLIGPPAVVPVADWLSLPNLPYSHLLLSTRSRSVYSINGLRSDPSFSLSLSLPSPVVLSGIHIECVVVDRKHFLCQGTQGYLCLYKHAQMEKDRPTTNAKQGWQMERKRRLWRGGGRGNRPTDATAILILHAMAATLHYRVARPQRLRNLFRNSFESVG